MDDQEFNLCFKEYLEEAFRLQTLPVYSVSEENKWTKAYLSGEPRPQNDSGFEGWLNEIKEKTKSGAKMIQVLVLYSPITPYTRQGLDWFWEYQAEAGAEIKWILPEKQKQFSEYLKKDFWLFDKKKLVRMDYDSEGHILGHVLIEDPKEIKKALEIRDLVLKNSTTLKETLSLIRRGLLR